MCSTAAAQLICKALSWFVVATLVCTKRVCSLHIKQQSAGFVLGNQLHPAAGYASSGCALTLYSLLLLRTCCYCCRPPDAGLAECTQLSNLRQLALKPHSSLADGSMLVVSRLTQLRSLALCLPSYSRPLLDGVKQLTGLRVRSRAVPRTATATAACV